MPAGQPTKYKPEYCEEIVRYFSIEPYEKKVVERIRTKGGDTIEKYKEVPSNLPLISKFAKSIGVTHETVDEWARRHPEFSLALKESKKLQEAHLITNALRGNFEQPFSIFTMKNISGWRDKVEVEHSGFIEQDEKKAEIKKEVNEFMTMMGVK